MLIESKPQGNLIIRSCETDMEEQIPIGFRFEPTDEQLIEFYLKRKVTGQELPRNSPIVEKDLYGDHPPWEIFTEDDFRPLGKSVYVYTKLKMASGNRIQRKLSSGTWTGQKKAEIKNSNSESIGYKTMLNFKANNRVSMPGGSWIMYEYSLPGDFNNSSIYVICRIKWKDFGVSQKRRFQESNKEDEVTCCDGGIPRLKAVDGDVRKQSSQEICIDGVDLGQNTLDDDELERVIDEAWEEIVVNCPDQLFSKTSTA